MEHGNFSWDASFRIFPWDFVFFRLLFPYLHDVFQTTHVEVYYITIYISIYHHICHLDPFKVTQHGIAMENNGPLKKKKKVHLQRLYDDLPGCRFLNNFLEKWTWKRPQSFKNPMKLVCLKMGYISGWNRKLYLPFNGYIYIYIISNGKNIFSLEYI